MDPETAKAWAPVVAAFVGGFVGALSALGVAWANIHGQRQIARDNAMREYRIARANALLDLADRRVREFAAVMNLASKSTTPTEVVGTALEQWRDNMLALHGSGFFAKRADRSEAAVELEFKDAMEKLMLADNAWVNAAVAEFRANGAAGLVSGAYQEQSAFDSELMHAHDRGPVHL